MSKNQLLQQIETAMSKLLDLGRKTEGHMNMDIQSAQRSLAAFRTKVENGTVKPRK